MFKIGLLPPLLTLLVKVYALLQLLQMLPPLLLLRLPFIHSELQGLLMRKDVLLLEYKNSKDLQDDV
jgi:hypothetical protein